MSIASAESQEDLPVNRSKNFKFETKRRSDPDALVTLIDEEGTTMDELEAQFALDLDMAEEMADLEEDEGQQFYKDELGKTFAEEELSVIYENTEPDST